VLSCALFITTLFLLETPYVGFNAFLTAALHIVYAFCSIVVLNKSPSAFSVRSNSSSRRILKRHGS
jgi:hypothetical protein